MRARTPRAIRRRGPTAWDWRPIPCPELWSDDSKGKPFPKSWSRADGHFNVFRSVGRSAMMTRSLRCAVIILSLSSLRVTAVTCVEGGWVTCGHVPPAPFGVGVPSRHAFHPTCLGTLKQGPLL